jgi:hypothetical protein
LNGRACTSGLCHAAHSKSPLLAGGVAICPDGFGDVTMVPVIIIAGEHGKMKAVMIGAMGLILFGQLLLDAAPHTIVVIL